MAALEILYAKVSLSAEDSSNSSNDQVIATNGDVASDAQASGNMYNPYQNMHQDLDFSGIIFDLHDMSWLNSAPGIL